MRRIYLVRHGHPDFAPGRRMCLGRTDLPLGPFGRMQACLLGAELSERKPFSCFSSPLLRCRQTAEAFQLPFETEDDLVEQNMGVWDGLDFETIRLSDPELYRARETDPLLVPAGAETLEQVQKRALPALRRCVESCSGNVVLFTHVSVIHAILADVMELPLAGSLYLRIPYGAYSVLTCDPSYHVEELKKIPRPEMTPELASALLTAAAPGERVEAHCRAVAKKAMEIADALPLDLDRNVLACAALRHDVARAEKNHAAIGAFWIEKMGYEKEAELIRQHHDPETDALNEAAILYLSDKSIREDKPVSIDERFALSAARCETAEAKGAHARRYAAAKVLQAKVNTLCSSPVIP